MEELLLQYATKEVLQMAVALWVIGLILAKIPNIPNWIIPILLLGAGIASGLLVVGKDITGAIHGIFACGVAVLADQLYKQAKYREKD